MIFPCPIFTYMEGRGDMLLKPPRQALLEKRDNSKSKLSTKKDSTRDWGASSNEPSKIQYGKL